MSYKNNVLRTDIQDYSVCVGRLDSRLMRILHSILGISSEVVELTYAIIKNDFVNIEEELGDLYWYATLLESEVPEPMKHRSVLPDCNLLDFLVEDISVLSDKIKRVIFYGSSLDESEISLRVASVFGVLDEFCKNLSLDIERVKEKNISKLKIRYPEKFQESSALNRDLEKEYEVLSDVISIEGAFLLVSNILGINLTDEEKDSIKKGRKGVCPIEVLASRTYSSHNVYVCANKKGYKFIDFN